MLIYAVDDSSPFHRKAHSWWNECLSSISPVGLCYPTVLGFIRIATSRRVYDDPLSLDESLAILDEWTAQPNTTFVMPTARHWPILQSLLVASGSAGNLTTDAHIAALAIEHGYTVYSNDADFGRFKTLSWVNPLQ